MRDLLTSTYLIVPKNAPLQLFATYKFLECSKPINLKNKIMSKHAAMYQETTIKPILTAALRLVVLYSKRSRNTKFRCSIR